MRDLIFLIILSIAFIISSCESDHPLVKTVVISNKQKLENLKKHAIKITFPVIVNRKYAGYFEQRGGTAFAVDKDGVLVTAAHVIDYSYKVNIYVGIKKDGLIFFKKVINYSFLKKKDLAILYINYKFKEVAKFRLSELKSAEFLCSVSYPHTPIFKLRTAPDIQPSISFGNFYKKTFYIRKGKPKIIVQASTILIWGGSSGSPIFDEDGYVVSVAVAVKEREYRDNDLSYVTLGVSVRELNNYLFRKYF